MGRSIITLLTDFGSGSHYVAQLKGVILGILPEVTLVDISHDVSPQQIAQATWLLRNSYAAFPHDTCHLVVVDPGVGSEREIWLARAASHYFIAPNNGLLDPLLADGPADFIFRLDNPAYWRSEVSATFHGRDIMAPCAAHLQAGVAPSHLGSRVDAPVRSPAQTSGELGQARSERRGEIVFIDAFGNLITNLRGLGQADAVGQLWVELPGQDLRIDDFVRSYSDRPAGQVVVLCGSNGDLEIAVVNGNAAERLAVRRGDPVCLRWT